MTSERTHEEDSRQAEGAPAGATGIDSGDAVRDTGAGGAEVDAAETPDIGSAGAEAAAGAAAAAAGESELEDLRDRYLRLAAEFDNYRKRTERERTDHSVRAQGRLVQSLLDAVDDLERVADYTEETTTVAALLEGVQMVERKLLRALETAGLERVEAHGAPFDPTHHEALMTAAAESPDEDDTVGEVFQKGYRFQGHLLRPARVQVRKHMG
jgi:molecular chaperone GrpE